MHDEVLQQLIMEDTKLVYETQEGERQKNLSILNEALSKRWDTGFVVL